MMAIHAKFKNWRPLLRAAMTLFALPMTFVSANEVGVAGPWIAAARIIRDGEVSASAIYLKSGLVITAAHLTAVEAKMGVMIAGINLPATVLKQGAFEDTDLTLLSVDQHKLPSSVMRIQTRLCEAPAWPGDPVIVVSYAGATQSHIISPQILPFTLRNKFSTLIADVTTTGGTSGSGVFDPKRKCLLGIMSRAFWAGDKAVAKYFVSAVEIRDFIPADLREPAIK